MHIFSKLVNQLRYDLSSYFEQSECLIKHTYLLTKGREVCGTLTKGRHMPIYHTYEATRGEYASSTKNLWPNE